MHPLLMGFVWVELKRDSFSFQSEMRKMNEIAFEFFKSKLREWVIHS